MNFLTVSRLAAAGTAVFAILAALGGMVLGFALGNGGYIAMACLMSGVALFGVLWWRESLHEDRPLTGHVQAAGFAFMAGLALYANLVWALWAAGVPVDIGTVREGKMGQHFWLGPFTLLYAITCYAFLHWQDRPETKR